MLNAAMTFSLHHTTGIHDYVVEGAGIGLKEIFKH